MPIVDTMLTEGSPCINPTEKDIANGRYLYPLTRIIDNSTYKYHGCKDSINNELYKDPRYDKIDQIEEQKLFKDNNIYLELKSLPMNQMDYSNTYIGLFTRPIIELELSCEYAGLGLNRAGLLERQENFSRIESWHSFLDKE